MAYRLCYIDGNKAWFTDNLEKQWGDDWNDVPYEHNAGEPYEYWSEMIEDNPNIWERKYQHHEIKLKTIYFETNTWSEKQPRDGYDNSPYSVKDINNKQVPWLHTDVYDIYAGTTYEDFIETIKKYNGKIYILDKDGE